MSKRPVVWIVNFESSHVLGDCLKRLTTAGVGRVYVADNGSSALEVSRLTDLVARFDDMVELILIPENLGFGGGVNAIAERVVMDPSDLLWILNPDTEASPDCATTLALNVVPGEADIVGPVILTGSGDRRRIWFSGGTIDRRAGLVVDSQLGRSVEALAAAPPSLETEFITGASMMMRRSTWDDIGGFRSELFLYWEDVDLCQRAAERGYRLKVVTEARIDHLEGASSRGSVGRRARSFYYMSRNRILVCRQRGARGVGLVFGPGALEFLRLLAYAVLRESHGRLRNPLSIVQGAIAALRSRPPAGETTNEPA